MTCPKNTPDAVTMRMELPSGETAEWLIPTIKLSELSLDEICDCGLYVLLPFCLFWYGRKKLKKCNDDEARLEELCTMVADVRGRLCKAHDDGKISDIVLNVLLEAMEYVSRKAAHGHDNVIKAADTMMGVNIPIGLIEFPTIRKLREAREEGEQRGRQEGGLNMLFGLVRGGHLGADIASAQAGLTLAAFNAKMAEYEARSQA